MPAPVDSPVVKESHDAISEPKFPDSSWSPVVAVVAAPPCAICGAPAAHTSGHTTPLALCGACVVTHIPTDDAGRPLIVGATHPVSPLGVGDD